MNKIQFQGHWNQLKGKLKEQFGKLTDNDFLKISGKRDELIGKLQAHYGWNKERIEKRLSEVENAYYADELRNNWNILQSKLKQKWNSLSDADLKNIKGNADQLLAQLQERYHFNRAKAEEEFHPFMESLTVMSGAASSSDKQQPRR